VSHCGKSVSGPAQGSVPATAWTRRRARAGPQPGCQCHGGPVTGTVAEPGPLPRRRPAASWAVEPDPPADGTGRPGPVKSQKTFAMEMPMVSESDTGNSRDVTFAMVFCLFTGPGRPVPSGSGSKAHDARPAHWQVIMMAGPARRRSPARRRRAGAGLGGSGPPATVTSESSGPLPRPPA
jgi:hypothetical protein